jgi:hypothetical protein
MGIDFFGLKNKSNEKRRGEKIFSDWEKKLKKKRGKEFEKNNKNLVGGTKRKNGLKKETERKKKK